MSSRALDAKQAVYDLVKALPQLSDLQVEWGFPVGNVEYSYVVIGDITWDSDDWATLQSREEKFKIAVITEVKITAADARTVELAAMGYSDAIEDALKANPGLGIGLPNIVTSSYEPGRLVSGPADDKYLAQVHGSLSVTARF